MKSLMRLVPAWTVEDAAAAFGNGGHESLGFTKLQEVKPIAGRGGFGWFQWTGPRRRAFEAWCREEGLDPAGPSANIGFLAHELATSERATVGKVSAALGLEAKTKAFEMAFERPGVAHTDRRLAWARIALDAYNTAYPATAVPLTPEKPKAPATVSGLDKPMALSTINVASLASAATGGIAAFSGLDWRVALPIVLVLGVLAAWVIWQRSRYARKAREAGV
ncbi:phage tail tip lysozyme [Pleomorphomonas koreensis]|uniref:phage tail tip lysozyme n=1 Tax=Pleomorphomonas koreensis TaxID=257440 RepID=UPI0012EC9D1A|nr:phage tail tip lysozyme [Pleomorphomonas koreensis]